MQNLTEELNPVESLDTNNILDKIIKNKWWQGSLIAASDLPIKLEENKGVDWWIIATQPCNLFNPDFQKVPVFEIVAAIEITECSPRMIKGDDPRVLHLSSGRGRAGGGAVALDRAASVQIRRGLARSLPAAGAVRPDPLLWRHVCNCAACGRHLEC